jgi:micrococcal nuclease
MCYHNRCIINTNSSGAIGDRLIRSIVALSMIGILLTLSACTMSADNSVPCLHAGGISFAPVVALPAAIRPADDSKLPIIRVQGIAMVPVRLLADACGGSVEWSPQTRDLHLQWSHGVLLMAALSGPEFWQNPTIHNLTNYTPTIMRTTCVRIVDGDTIVLSDGRRLRYIGIDTPETKHPQKPVEYFGREASLYNRSLVEGKAITVEFDISKRDRYERLLGYVYVGDIFVNAELLSQGYAQTLTYPPDVRYVELFAYLQNIARNNGRGLWAGRQSETPAHLADTRGYVGSRKSNVYHLPHCRHVVDIIEANLRWFETPAAARRAGYHPCRTCNPHAE